LDYFNPLARPFWITVGMALLCGAVVGLERQLRGKPAGVRTSILICLSTSVFIHLGAAASGGQGDPSRVLGQLVTGVTTAAVIWVLAAIGAAIGLGNHLGALALALVTVGVLTGIELLESSARWLTRGIYQKE
jgi:putative Mg2+ transporter-C (MgtC) family protein